MSCLNVIRAIRDLPDPDSRSRSVKGILLAILTPLVGALVAWLGLQSEQEGVYMLGLSLVVIGAALYGMLEPMRQYGRQLLEEGGEGDEVGDRHAHYYLALAERVAPELIEPWRWR